MKRLAALLLILLMVLTLASCSKKSEPLASLDIPKKEEVAPYRLSEKELQLLRAFAIDINGNAQVFSFKTPKGTKAVEVNAYALSRDFKWESIGGTTVSANDEVPVEQQGGLLSMVLGENYAIDFSLSFGNCTFYFKSDEIESQAVPMVSYKAYLPEAQEIEFNREIPVALLVYDSGTSMRSYVPGDYSDPSKFEGMDLVQAVTLRFLDKEFTPPAQ